MDAAVVVKLFFESLIGVVSLVGNVLVLIVIIRNRSLHTVTNYLIGSLAVSDLLVGAIGVPAVMVSNSGLPRNFYGCLLLNCTHIILVQVSIFK